MMYGRQKSDPCKVAKKSANKSEGADAESAERRRGAEGSAQEPSTCRTQSRGSVLRRLECVRERARLRKKERFTALLHHVDVELLRWAYLRIKRGAAAGVDGQTWEQYGEQLEAKLVDLHARVHQGGYHPLPSRRKYIAKADGRLRPLGIAALEDKILQRAIVAVLNAVYEEEFLGFSYGFRPGRGQHDALDALATGITCTKVNWIVDLDVASFFDRVSHSWLMRFLEHRIGDRRVLRLMEQWLKAGVMEDGVLKPTEEGTPQGAVVSPLAANVYLHYVFDLWAKRWRHREARGNVIYVRYADDIVAGFEHEADARRFLRELRERLGDFALTLHPEKTRLIEFGRYASERRAQRGLGKPETFNFLGFTHTCSRRRRGGFALLRMTCRERMQAKLRSIKEELRWRRHQSSTLQGEYLRQVVRGFLAYHAVPLNWLRLYAFRNHVIRLWRRTLRRRSQKDFTSWRRARRLARRWIPPVRIQHPWPDQRFRVKHPRWEPSAPIAPARICAGGLG